ncbi:Ig-like domain-containing protein [Marinigracilibium pacificum]|uniref:Tandem-95 repeat protein n=1 Tax=Marinigracilibium pacificum TaxID=2729599 RepID=A0A848J315_9BACT|nr:Ig-like domain-containing protein [Marinigracilibium pacificum]NMM50146.1 tandem-95 repeat protein [Marinigracilibium pacificum]
MSPLPHYKEILISILVLLLPITITSQEKLQKEIDSPNRKYAPNFFLQQIDPGTNTPLVNDVNLTEVKKQQFSDDSITILSIESPDSRQPITRETISETNSSSILNMSTDKQIDNFEILSISVCGDSPIGTPDYYKTASDRTLQIAAPGFLQNDIDLQGEAISATAILKFPENGIVTAFADGSFSYIPNSDFVGEDVFAYRMRDASSNYSDSIFVTIIVTEPANRTPIGQDDVFSVPANKTLEIVAPGFLQNDADQDGEIISATAILKFPEHGIVTAFADGSFNYIPDAGFVGEDMFAYRMRDASLNYSDSVFVTINVLEGNRPPEGIDDNFIITKNTTLSIPASGFLINDFDPDGDAISATAILKFPNNGIVTAFADGSFSYIPDSDFTGEDKFVYRMRDASLNYSDSVTVNILVVENGTLPVGVNDHFKISNDRTLTVEAPGFLINDIDLNGENIFATAILDLPDHGNLSALVDGKFVYDPDDDFVGIDKFAYRIRDASLNYSDSVFVTIEVTAATNRPPIGFDDYYTALTNTVLSVDSPGFLINDVDQDSEAISATAILDLPDHGNLSALVDGKFTYSPDPDFEGMDSFAYRMRDASLNYSDSVRVFINVVKGNRDPAGLDDHYTAIKNTVLTIEESGFLLNDFDADNDDIFATAILKLPKHGGLSALGNGKFVYSPDADYVGSDYFVYRMRDAALNYSDSVRVFIEVIQENQPPVAVFNDQTYECEGPGGTEITLDGSGSYDPEEGTLLFSWFKNGELIAGPSIEPTTVVLLQVGSHDFTLKVVDECGKEDSKVATISVDDSLPPEVIADFVLIGKNEYAISCSVNDICSENLTVSSIIKTPQITNPAVSYKVSSKYSIEIDMIKNTVDVKAPNPQSFWTMVVNDQGVSVNDGQVLELKYDKNKFQYKFDDSGNLISVKGDVISLVCTATDEENNTTSTEALLPMSPASELSSLQINSISRNATLNHPINYPNPFSSKTTIRYAVETEGNVSIKIFDQSGKQLDVLVDSNHNSGIYEVNWDSKNYQNGIYIYEIRQNNFVHHGKMILQKE